MFKHEMPDYTIRIEKPKDRMRDPLDRVHYEIAVNDVIGDHATVSSGPYKESNLRSFMKGILGLETYVFGTN